MNDPHSATDNGISKTEGGFLFDDWTTEDKGLTDSTTLFDGKIIARMPDLGSESSVIKTIEKPQFPSFWMQVRTAAASVFQDGTSDDPIMRKRFFQRVTTLGGIVLLCGFGILFVGTGNEDPADGAAGVAEKTKSFSTGQGTFVSESPFSPVVQTPIGRDHFVRPEPSNVMPGVASPSAIPVAPVESVVAVSPQASPWDRPATNSFSPWETPPSSPANPFQPMDAAAIHTASPRATSPHTTSLVPSDTVVMSPMTPIHTAVMPVSPHEMPVSRHETQLIAQSNHPTLPHGMVPMQGRQDNMPGNMPGNMQGNMQGNMSGNMQQGIGVVPQHHPQYHPQWQTPAPHQSVPTMHAPPVYGTGVPMNQGQFGPQSQQYVMPPGYMVPSHQMVPVSTPIPSGVSTLPPQGGPQHMQPYGMPVQHQPLGTPPMQRPPSDFYSNPPQPPTSRWM